MKAMSFKFAPYSFSKLNTFVNCPKRFEYKYVKKEKEGRCDRSALERGSAIHEMFEHHEKNKEPKQSKYTKDFKKALVSKSVQNIKKHLETPKNTCREVSFGLTPEFTPCDYNSKDALFRGKIDLVYVHEGMLELIDYKTGKPKSQKYQSYDQLLLYSIYFFQRYNTLQKLKVSYVYVDHDVVNSFVVDKTIIHKWKHHFLEIVNDIETAKEFLPNHSRLCHWCPFEEKCEWDLDY